ncbi:MAG: carbonic anhydrase [Myxococcota bacterium]
MMKTRATLLAALLSLSYCTLPSLLTLSLLSPSTAMASGATPAMGGWEAFSRIQAGNKRFISGDITYRPDPESRAVLANGQKPHTIVLTCSDSRLPPELIFDQGLGEIFTVRVAGNIADAHAIASIEYAIEHLGARLVVVMGHESCGAVKAALTTPKGSSAGTKSLDVLVRDIQRNLDGNMLFSPADKTLVAPVKTNVSAVARELITSSPVIQHMLESKELVMAQAIYSLASGEVSFFYAGVPEVPAHGSSASHDDHVAAVDEHGHGAASKAPHKAKPRAKKKKMSHSRGHGAAAQKATGHGAPAHSAAPVAPAATHSAPMAAPTGTLPPSMAAPASAPYTPPAAPAAANSAPAAAPAASHGSGH